MTSCVTPRSFPPNNGAVILCKYRVNAITYIHGRPVIQLMYNLRPLAYPPPPTTPPTTRIHRALSPLQTFCLRQKQLPPDMIYRIVRAFQRVDIEKHGGNTVGSCCPGVSRVKECKQLSTCLLPTAF